MPQSRLLDQVRTAIRLRHYGIRTEEAYVQWIRRFILYHRKRHPREMGVGEIRQYLSHPATDENVAAAPQNVALAALLFLHREVLVIELPLAGAGQQRAQAPAGHQARPVGAHADDARGGEVQRGGGGGRGADAGRVAAADRGDRAAARPAQGGHPADALAPVGAPRDSASCCLPLR